MGASQAREGSLCRGPGLCAGRGGGRCPRSQCCLTEPSLPLKIVFSVRERKDGEVMTRLSPSAKVTFPVGISVIHLYYYRNRIRYPRRHLPTGRAFAGVFFCCHCAGCCFLFSAVALSFVCSMYLRTDQTFEACRMPGRHWEQAGNYKSDRVLVHA